MSSRLIRGLVLVVAITVLGACSSAEPPEEHGTPVDAKLFIQGTEVTPDVTLPAGQTVRVEVRFLDADGDVITGLEDEHYTALTFSPASLATTAAVTGQRFFVDVTVQAAAGATGTVSVGYGHDALADEDSFGPFDVAIQ